MLRFYLPESDDLVDRNYDFVRDRYGSGSGDRWDQYAHQITGAHSFDGLLVSRSTVGKRKLEKIIHSSGVHGFFGLPKTVPVISDSGAFQYARDDFPSYSPEECCEFYSAIGVDYGVTLDHLIFEFDPEYDSKNSLFAPNVPQEARRRLDITVSGAREMMRIHRERGYEYQLIGGVQGWSPQSYVDCAKQLIDLGYTYIAIGGMAKARDGDIRLVLEAMAEAEIGKQTGIHMFGVARLSLMEDFKRAGVISCDSASTIFQAFKSDNDNYHTREKNYTAVRIPPVADPMSPKVRKLLNAESAANGDQAAIELRAYLAKLEQEALSKVRAYADRKVSLEDAMTALVAYDEMFGENRRAFRAFEETLKDRPWEQCDCPICREIGIEVVILRGNNRNRRRGFHNTWVFYEQFKRKRAELYPEFTNQVLD